MTNKEAAVLVQEVFNAYNALTGGILCSDHITALIKTIHTMNNSDWIPVEIKPPKEEKTYLIQTDGGYICLCRWTNNAYGLGVNGEWRWSFIDIPQYSKVVAWREKPTLFEADKN